MTSGKTNLWKPHTSPGSLSHIVLFFFFLNIGDFVLYVLQEKNQNVKIIQLVPLHTSAWINVQHWFVDASAALPEARALTDVVAWPVGQLARTNRVDNCCCHCRRWAEGHRLE